MVKKKKSKEETSIKYVRDFKGDTIRISKLPHLRRIRFPKLEDQFALQVLLNEIAPGYLPSGSYKTLNRIRLGSDSRIGQKDD